MDNENEHTQVSQVDKQQTVMNDGESFDDECYSAPVEVLAEFLSTLMARNYKSALYYCKLILQYEPENEIVQDFYPLILEKLHSDTCESDECGNTDENKSTLSENSTEYFTSTSVASANTSLSSSFSSDEEDTSLNHPD